jgi:hypothetical protein
MLLVMPKPSKSKPKPKAKPKGKVKPEPEAPSITSNRTYWVVLTVVFAVVSAVFSGILGFNLVRAVAVTVTVAVLIAAVGFIRVSPSKLSLGKRATFIFIGASVIGFGIWAALALALMPQLVVLDDQFYVVATLAMCLATGAVAGELISRIQKLQERLFPQNL